MKYESGHPNIIERIKFYADTPLQKNKYFCFKIENIAHLRKALFRLQTKGFKFRAIWWEVVAKDTGEIIENERMSLDSINESYIVDLRERSSELSSN